jgi:hypothetical protein
MGPGTGSQSASNPQHDHATVEDADALICCSAIFIPKQSLHNGETVKRTVIVRHECDLAGF